MGKLYNGTEAIVVGLVLLHGFHIAESKILLLLETLILIGYSSSVSHVVLGSDAKGCWNVFSSDSVLPKTVFGQWNTQDVDC